MIYNLNNILKKTIYCLIAITLLMINTASPAYSVEFEIIQFTNNAFDDLRACYYNGTIAWSQDKNNDGFEIFYWNGIDTVQVTQTDSYSDFVGSCHNGQIAWSGNDGGADHEIFFWDGNSIIQVTNDNSHDLSPSLYDGTIAWYSYVTGGAQINYWDGTTTRQITNSGYNFGPSLYNGTIAWDGMPTIGIHHEIYYWDGSSIRQITNNGTDDQGPSLYNGTIAWRGFDGINYQIYYWNGASTIQITNNDIDNGFPSLYNGKIAWVASDGNHPQVYFWDGASITQVTNTNTNKDGCQLYDGVITWAELDGNDREIYYARPDNTPPTVFSTLPADLDANISVNRCVSATFSEAMIGSTVNDVTFSINNGITGVVTYSAGNFTATLTPSTALNFNTTYTALITSSVTDKAGNNMAQNYSWSFTTSSTPDTLAPTIFSNIPIDGDQNVSANTGITVSFSEDMDASTISSSSFTIDNGITGTINYDANTMVATFTPVTALANWTTYTATITTDVKDLSGNPLSSNHTWSFTTEPTPDTIPPHVDSTNPSANSTSIASNSIITATFSEPMDASTINSNTFALNHGVTGIIRYDTNTMVATFTPITALANGTTYTATITTDVKDLAGNSLQENFAWSFTTETIVSQNSNVDVKEVEKLHCFISSAEYGHSMPKYISLFIIVLGGIVIRLSTQERKEKH